MALFTRRRFYCLFVFIVAAFLIEFWVFVPFAPKHKIPIEGRFSESGMQSKCAIQALYPVDDSILDIWDMHSCLTDFLEYDTMCILYFKQQEYGPPKPFSEYNMLAGMDYDPAFDRCKLPNETTSPGKAFSKTAVPRFVYYVFYGLKTLTFMEYMSFLSVMKFVKPWFIYVISDRKPTGHWWNQIEAEMGVRFIERPRPKWIGDTHIAFTSHAENMVALQSLLVNGGIALDLDVLLLRSLDPLLQYSVTVGLLSKELGIGSDVILSTRNNPFLMAWHNKYSFYKAQHPEFNLQRMPYGLYKSNPKLVHLESTRFYYPPETEVDDLFISKREDWRDNYAMHLWPNPSYPYPESVDDIKLMDNTLGQALRYVYYGDPRLVNTNHTLK